VDLPRLDSIVSRLVEVELIAFRAGETALLFGSVIGTGRGEAEPRGPVVLGQGANVQHCDIPELDAWFREAVVRTPVHYSAGLAV
jgi:hypothetical protein